LVDEHRFNERQVRGVSNFRSPQINWCRAIALVAGTGLALIPAASSQSNPAAPGSAASGLASPASSANAASPAAFSYEVVSVKPSNPVGAQGVEMWWRSTPDGFSAMGTTVENLMIDAFGLLLTDQIVNLPAWGSSDRIDIEAKMDDDTAAAFKKLSKDEKRSRDEQMLQSVLADRFQLKTHHETRDLPIYELVVAKSGLKMTASPEKTTSGWSMGRGQFSGHAVPLDNFVFSLSNEVSRLVVNKTGLTGNYEITLKWTPDEMRASADSSNAASPAPGESGPSIFAALEEQLGLKLVSTKGPVDVIVVDHVERPSEN
jgi:uncharacterized protein (TIGR03435 family)